MSQPALRSRAHKRTFAEAFDPKQNAFGFLRLLLAILVIFSHSFPLGGFGIDALEAFTRGRHTVGLAAVAMFFVLSGFLITRSASGSVSVARFIWHRFLRIFPGYWTCLIVCAFIFAPLIAFVEYGTLLGIFAAPRTSPQSFVLHNAGLLHLNDFSLLGIVNISPQSIAGLFRHNPVPHLINGSLWTLPFEVVCYLGVAVLALCCVLRRARWVVLAAFVGLWFLCAHSYLYPESFNRCFPVPGLNVFVPLALSFSAGCLCFVYREKIPYSAWIFAVCLILVSLSLPFGVFGLATPIFMTYVFLWLAFTLPFSRFEARGDYSYGTYIYAFPVQQVFALAGLQENGFALYFGGSVLMTLILAILSYRLVEAPCLRWKNVDVGALIRGRFGRATISTREFAREDAVAIPVNP